MFMNDSSGQEPPNTIRPEQLKGLQDLQRQAQEAAFLHTHTFPHPDSADLAAMSTEQRRGVNNYLAIRSYIERRGATGQQAHEVALVLTEA